MRGFVRYEKVVKWNAIEAHAGEVTNEVLVCFTYVLKLLLVFVKSLTILFREIATRLYKVVDNFHYRGGPDIEHSFQFLMLFL